MTDCIPCRIWSLRGEWGYVQRASVASGSSIPNGQQAGKKAIVHVNIGKSRSTVSTRTKKIMPYSEGKDVVLVGLAREDQGGTDATSKTMEGEIGQMVDVFLSQDQI